MVKTYSESPMLVRYPKHTLITITARSDLPKLITMYPQVYIGWDFKAGIEKAGKFIYLRKLCM